MTDDNSPLQHQRNGGSRPVPDPTELTDRAIARLEKSLTEYIDGQLAVRDERLNGIDEATKLRLTGVDRLSDEIDSKVGRLRDVHDERFKGIDKQFLERDTRQERESRDNKVAVDAAFAAQKEAAAKQDEGNAKSIDKSEAGTKELLKALDDKIDDLKGRLDRGEGRGNGAQEARVESHQSAVDIRTLIFAVIGAGIGIAGLMFALMRTP